MTKKNKELNNKEIKQSNISTEQNLDDAAIQLAELQAIIFESPETSQAKVEVIKEEVAAGRYEIHSSRIAAKLLEFVPMTEEAEIA